LVNDYTYPASAGNGTTVYVISSGIRRDHVQFEGRVEWGATCTPNGCINGIADDDIGTGTQLAGVIGGLDYGVAKNTRMVAVKVSKNGSVNYESLAAGIFWVVDKLARGNPAKSVVK
jgi:cerevisin